MKSANPEVRDLIYFDVDKASSLFSQFESGLITEVQDEREEAKDERNIRTYDLKLFRPEFGGVSSEKRSQIETKIVHHDLLDRLEQALFSGSFAVDLNTVMDGKPKDGQSIRSGFAEYACLRATGLASIEDYQRLTRIASKINPVVSFIEQCSRATLEQSDEFKALKDSLEEQEAEAKKEKDRNKRAVAVRRVEETQRQLDSLLDGLLKTEGVEDWLIDGIQLFVDTFLKDRVILRLYPFTEVPEFAILGNLKRDAFVDPDIENLLFAYGPRPDLRLSVIGIVTSLPAPDGHPMEELRQAQKDQASESDEQAFEEGFRGAFEGIEGLERFVRYSRYPSVTVYPVAVYRGLPVADTGPLAR